MKPTTDPITDPRAGQQHRLLSTLLVATLAVFGLVAGCTPTVQVAAPPEPITINLNIRIEHELRVRIDRELDDILAEDSGLF